MSLPRALRRACLLTAAVLLTASIGVKPLYAVDDSKADANKTATKSQKKKVAKETQTKPKLQAEVPPSTGWNPGGY